MKEFNEVKVKDYVREKGEKSDVVVNIPKQPVFYRTDFGATIIAVVPERIETANLPKLRLNLYKVSYNSLIKAILPVNVEIISGILSYLDDADGVDISPEDVLREFVLLRLIERPNEDRVNEDAFREKLDSLMKSVSLQCNVDY